MYSVYSVHRVDQLKLFLQSSLSLVDLDVTDVIDK